MKDKLCGDSKLTGISELESEFQVGFLSVAHLGAQQAAPMFLVILILLILCVENRAVF